MYDHSSDIIAAAGDINKELKNDDDEDEEEESEQDEDEEDETEENALARSIQRG